MIKKIKSFLNWFLDNHIYLYVVSFIFFYVNSSYVSYPDEFVNIMAGKRMLQGQIPYSGIFDHHMPGAWLLSAVLQLFSFNSFVLFRFWWAMFAFALLLLLVLWIRKNYKEFYPYAVFFSILYPLMGVYFWFHLFLADSIAALLFAVIFWILIVQTLTKRFSYKATVVASLLTFSLVFTSLTYVYMCGALYLWQLYLLFSNKFTWKRFFVYAGISVLPGILFLLFLLISQSFADFYKANVVYNTELYVNIPNFEKGRIFNPIKFALTLIYNFLGTYIPLLSQIKYFDIYFPMGTVAGLSTLVLLIIMGYRNVLLGVIYFLILTLSTPRSDVSKLSETDYQMTMFLVLGAVSSLVVLYVIRTTKIQDQLLVDLKRVVGVIISIFLVFCTVFLLNNTYSKYYQRYTQKMPSINDLSYTGSFVNDVIGKDDYYWVGPYHPEDVFFVEKGRLPGKYFFMMPQFGEHDYFRNDFISQFETNKPTIIMFRHEDSIFMTPADKFGKFLLDWMDKKYSRLNEEEVELLKSPSSFNIRTDFYILNEDKEEVLQRMKDTGYINIK